VALKVLECDVVEKVSNGPVRVIKTKDVPAQIVYNFQLPHPQYTLAPNHPLVGSDRRVHIEMSTSRWRRRTEGPQLHHAEARCTRAVQVFHTTYLVVLWYGRRHPNPVVLWY
jgi:hypothetical protein